jgi:hypothetical protein
MTYAELTETLVCLLVGSIGGVIGAVITTWLLALGLRVRKWRFQSRFPGESNDA